MVCVLCVCVRLSCSFGDLLSFTLTAFVELMDHGIVSWDTFSVAFIKKVGQENVSLKQGLGVERNVLKRCRCCTVYLPERFYFTVTSWFRASLIGSVPVVLLSGGYMSYNYESNRKQILHCVRLSCTTVIFDQDSKNK